jgi:hypothetical protein
MFWVAISGTNSRQCPLLHNLKPWEEENRQWNFLSLVWIAFALWIRLDYSLIVQVITLVLVWFFRANVFPAQ